MLIFLQLLFKSFHTVLSSSRPLIIHSVQKHLSTIFLTIKNTKGSEHALQTYLHFALYSSIHNISLNSISLHTNELPCFTLYFMILHASPSTHTSLLPFSLHINRVIRYHLRQVLH
ncbi:hypothetical protein O6H91_16G040400 [Diphasiastrum complanatum]|uniref:Uncharacterized protein n=1 Tax=Diphasiastrum complanatum TaxID=34168 RepID=A0ACC2BCM9_DIPCM|nr:hypothetical protein O6H91_16G040400 [Diphasiastrum complanatum]